MNSEPKLSELIRKAADEHLAADFLDSPKVEKRNCIWNALQLTVGNFTATMLAGDIEDGEAGIHDSNEAFHNYQCVRFMYLEFLALEAEDLEREAGEQELYSQEVIKEFAFRSTPRDLT